MANITQMTLKEESVWPKITLVVTISTAFKVRKWLAMKLIETAVLLLSCRVEFVEPEED